MKPPVPLNEVLFNAKNFKKGICPNLANDWQN
jgi:hypothetical protein